MRKTGTSTAFLKECMADALLLLMKETPMEKLSIQTITETAGTGRATWFRHFHSKSEALSFKLISAWQVWAEEHQLRERTRFSVENARTFFEFNLSIREILETIYQSGQSKAVYDAFQTVMGTRYDYDPAYCYHNRFYYSGLYGLLDEWIQGGFQQTPEEMADIVWTIIKASDSFSGQVQGQSLCE